VARNLSEVEGMSLEALRAGIDWQFESFADYLDLLEKKGRPDRSGRPFLRRIVKATRWPRIAPTYRRRVSA
jgi:hypothetical protein